MHADVVVLGGGIIGATSAYTLAKNGYKVLLLDKFPIGHGASSKSAAMIELQIYAFRGEPFFSLAIESRNMFPTLADEIKKLTGQDIHYDPCGILQLAMSADEAATLQSEIERQSQLGLSAEWLSAPELKKRFPQLTARHFGAAFFKEDGQVNAGDFLTAMIDAAKKLGVDVRDNVKNLKIVKNGQHVAVHTGDELIEANWVIAAAGAWTDETLAPLGIKLGIKPIRGQLLFYETPGGGFPHPIYAERNGYITPKKTGVTLVGSTAEETGFDDSTTENAKNKFIELTRQMLPELTSKKISMMTAGLRPRSPDELPFIGALKNYPNLIIAAGHFRNGILLAPITAKIIVDTIQKKSLPAHHQFFSPARAL